MSKAKSDKPTDASGMVYDHAALENALGDLEGLEAALWEVVERIGDDHHALVSMGLAVPGGPHKALPYLANDLRRLVQVAQLAFHGPDKAEAA